MALTAAVPAAVVLRVNRSAARARAAAPARCSAAPQRAAAPALRSAFVAAPLAPVRKALAHRNCRAAARRSVAVASADLPSLESAPVITLTSGVGPLLPASPGIYAVYDAAGALQYVGMSRKMNASIMIHMQDMPADKCASVKLHTVTAQSREALQGAWKQWIQEHIDASGSIPAGNTPEVKDWTTRKNRQNKAEIKLTSGKGLADLTVPLSTILDSVVKQNKVVAFIKGTRAAPECGFSKRMILNLEECGVDYEVVNVLDNTYNPGVREEIKTYSQWPTIPQLYAHGQFLGGADITGEMHDRGELKKALATAPA